MHVATSAAIPCYVGNGFVESWERCGERDHQGIIPIMLVHDLHLSYRLIHGQPYDVVDPSTGKHYFVDVGGARLVRRGSDDGTLYLTLREPNGRAHVLRWSVSGEFDKYLGATPPLR